MRGTVDAVKLEAIRRGLSEGLTWSQIGRRLGCSKNAVSGYVRRHIYGPENGYRNPALAHVPRKVYVRNKPRKPPKPKLQPVVQLPPPPMPTPTLCQWPTNDCRPWRFCEQPAEAGLPYCLMHCHIAFPTLGRMRHESAF